MKKEKATYIKVDHSRKGRIKEFLRNRKKGTNFQLTLSLGEGFEFPYLYEVLVLPKEKSIKEENEKWQN